MFDHGLSGQLWLIHCKPYDEEVLSSWVSRLSWAYGTEPRRFCTALGLAACSVAYRPGYGDRRGAPAAVGRQDRHASHTGHGHHRAWLSKLPSNRPWRACSGRPGSCVSASVLTPVTAPGCNIVPTVCTQMPTRTGDAPGCWHSSRSALTTTGICWTGGAAVRCQLALASQRCREEHAMSWVSGRHTTTQRRCSRMAGTTSAWSVSKRSCSILCRQGDAGWRLSINRRDAVLQGVAPPRTAPTMHAPILQEAFAQY